MYVSSLVFYNAQIFNKKVSKKGLKCIDGMLKRLKM